MVWRHFSDELFWWVESEYEYNAGRWRYLCGGIWDAFREKLTACDHLRRVLTLIGFCVWRVGVWLVLDETSESIPAGLGIQISGGGVTLNGEFEVRVFDEWEWVESKVGVTSIGIKGGWFNLDEILRWSEKDPSNEKNRGISLWKVRVLIWLVVSMWCRNCEVVNIWSIHVDEDY